MFPFGWSNILWSFLWLVACLFEFSVDHRTWFFYSYHYYVKLSLFYLYEGVDVKKIDECIGDPEADVDNPVLKAEQDAQVRSIKIMVLGLPCF